MQRDPFPRFCKSEKYTTIFKVFLGTKAGRNPFNTDSTPLFYSAQSNAQASSQSPAAPLASPPSATVPVADNPSDKVLANKSPTPDTPSTELKRSNSDWQQLQRNLQRKRELP